MGQAAGGRGARGDFAGGSRRAAKPGRGGVPCRAGCARGGARLAAGPDAGAGDAALGAGDVASLLGHAVPDGRTGPLAPGCRVRPGRSGGGAAGRGGRTEPAAGPPHRSVHRAPRAGPRRDGRCVRRRAGPAATHGGPQGDASRSRCRTRCCGGSSTRPNCWGGCTIRASRRSSMRALRTDGHGPQPYLAMELVDGLPLNTYCESRGLTTAERLELVAACAMPCTTPTSAASSTATSSPRTCSCTSRRVRRAIPRSRRRRTASAACSRRCSTSGSPARRRASCGCSSRPCRRASASSSARCRT